MRRSGRSNAASGRTSSCWTPIRWPTSRTFARSAAYTWRAIPSRARSGRDARVIAENGAPMRKLIVAMVVALLAGAVLAAEDWPEIRGQGRLGVWTETGIVEKFPADGLKVLWR